MLTPSHVFYLLFDKLIHPCVARQNPYELLISLQKKGDLTEYLEYKDGIDSFDKFQ